MAMELVQSQSQAPQQQQPSPSPPPPPPPQERKRVKVYELKNNDWYDRGTGFCSGRLMRELPDGSQDDPDARISVVSEDDPERVLLETRITKDDGYQKQQDTLIVWTEQNGVDMALSFQEAEGCASIWAFVSEWQQRLSALAPDDGLSDDLLDTGAHSVALPEPELGRLQDVLEAVRTINQIPAARDALAKYIMSPEQMYILKLTPLVEEAERQQDAPELHNLCSILKHIILLNDTSIIEFIVTDPVVMGVVGALEYDPDFPSHRANHRQYLSDSSKFKEVVPITTPEILKKIHYTYRLLYLKDVVLARILDDPTFSVLNSLIFFHQVDIVNHLQSNQPYLAELFSIFHDDANEEKLAKRKDAVLFIQNCCAVSKNIQAQSRAQLYQNFIHHGLFSVITFSLRHYDAAVRVAGTDILVALIDHDPQIVRNHIFHAIKENMTPLTETLIELLLVEVDLGVKSQMADAIKILYDPSSANGMEMMRAGQANSEIMAKRNSAVNGMILNGVSQASPQTEQFIQSFYEGPARRLFQPIMDLDKRHDMRGLSVQETSMMTHLIDILCFFVRQHSYRSKLFILGENLHCRVAQLLQSPHKYMKLAALKWYRTCISLHDEFHNRQLIQNRLFEPIINIVYETMPRDNLLNSNAIEIFEYIKREHIKQLIVHIAEQYRERIIGITYVNTFQQILLKYDQFQAGYEPQNGTADSSYTTQEDTPARMINGVRYGPGLREMDDDEEAYFNADDDAAEEDEELGLPTAIKVGLPNGASPIRPLVDYPDDDEDMEHLEHINLLANSPDRDLQERSEASSDDVTDGFHAEDARDRIRGRDRKPVPLEGSPGRQGSPPEPMAVKRRREDEDDDELGKLMGGTKRRNSSASTQHSLVSQAGKVQLDAEGSPVQRKDENHAPATQFAPKAQHQPTAPQQLRRKGSLKTKNEGGAGKFAIKPIGLVPAKRKDDDAASNGNHESAATEQQSDGGAGGDGAG